MNFVFQPWQLALAMLVGWANRQQQEAIEYLRAENQVLREKLGKQRILLSDDQRKKLAVKGKVLGRKLLTEVGTLFSPDTILRWHRELIAKKFDSSGGRKPGRPRIRQEIVDCILRFARENPSWGYDRLVGALAGVGYVISPGTVANVLRQHGVDPAPDRKRQTTWKTFLKAHWHVLAAIDFTTVEVWTCRGLLTFYLLFAMELKTRRMKFVGSTVSPNEQWMQQAARELTNCEDGFLNGKRYLILDRDTKFCQSFQEILQGEHIKPVLLPPRSPNLNAHLERFFGSLKRECLNRMIIFGESSLRNAVKEFLTHYHTERAHQGLENELIDPGEEHGRAEGEIIRVERLGGLLNYYHRRAA